MAKKRKNPCQFYKVFTIFVEANKIPLHKQSIKGLYSFFCPLKAHRYLKIMLNRFGPCLLLLVTLLPGCRHVVQEDRTPVALVQNTAYSVARPEQPAEPSPQWWFVLEDPLLTGYIHQALESNFTIHEGLTRLKQIRLNTKQTDAALYPGTTGTLRLDADGNRKDISERIGLSLAWEADLWGKLSAAAAASFFDSLAAEEALQQLALYLSVEVAQAYFQLIEQELYLDLLQEQMEANQTSLHLVKLRFAHGLAALADVYQQEELLSSVKAQIPPAESQQIVLRNRLSVLLGQTPNSSPFPLAEKLPKLPPLPQLGIPADLLLHRPDLRRLQREVAAADHRAAEAAAKRLPSLKLGGSVGLASGNFVLAVFTEALASISDWGQKKDEAEKQRLRVEEKMAAWSQAYLEAVEEVENALHQEEQHEALLNALEEQLRLAEAAFQETLNRYLQGVSDYLPVLSALSSQQRLERTLLQRQRERISFRLRLYRALGGTLFDTLESSDILSMREHREDIL